MEKSISKRLLAVMLSLAMVFSLVGANIFSASAVTSGDYEYRILGDGTAEITKYNGKDIEVSVPSYLDGYKVTSIGDKAFFGNVYLILVSIPNTVTRIGEEAFSCSKLEKIVIPESVSSIEYYAFNACMITDFVVDERNNYFSSVDGVLFNKAKTTIIRYPSGRTESVYTIPNGVLEIGNNAFEFTSSLTKIVIPDTVKSIKYDAFSNTDLLEIDIPNSVTYIGEGAFSNTSITSVTLPKNLTAISDSMFYGCKSLESIRIPKSVKSIGNSSFFICYSLKVVYFEGSQQEWSKLIANRNPGYYDCLKNAVVFYNQHEHPTLKDVNKKAATYFAKGYSGDTKCTTCGEIVIKGKATAKKTLKKPTVRVTADKNQIKVKYKKVKNATGFQVQYKIGKKTVTKTYSTKKSATKKIKKLKSGTYKVKVRAFVKSGKKKAYSKWTKTKTLNISR